MSHITNSSIAHGNVHNSQVDIQNTVMCKGKDEEVERGNGLRSTAARLARSNVVGNDACALYGRVLTSMIIFYDKRDLVDACWR